MAGDGLNHVSMTLTEQLPILQVLVPFVAAPLIVFIGSRSLAWPIAFASSIASLAIAVLLLGQVIDGDVISYHIGGWAPPLGQRLNHSRCSIGQEALCHCIKFRTSFLKGGPWLGGVWIPPQNLGHGTQLYIY